MTLVQLLDLLQSYIQAWPERGDLPVYLSVDEEGNDYKDINADCLAHLYTDPNAFLRYILTAKDLEEVENEGTDVSDYKEVIVIYPN